MCCMYILTHSGNQWLYTNIDNCLVAPKPQEVLFNVHIILSRFPGHFDNSLTRRLCNHDSFSTFWCGWHCKSTEKQCINNRSTQPNLCSRMQVMASTNWSQMTLGILLFMPQTDWFLMAMVSKQSWTGRLRLICPHGSSVVSYVCSARE